MNFRLVAPRGDRESHRTLQGARLRLSRLCVCAVDGARAAAHVAGSPSVDHMLPRDRWLRGSRPRAAGGDDPHLGAAHCCRSKIHDKCRRNGLLVSTEGSTVLLLPSLAIDKRTAARGPDIRRARYDAPRRRGRESESPARDLGPGTIAGTGSFATVAHGTAVDSVLEASATICLHEC